MGNSIEHLKASFNLVDYDIYFIISSILVFFILFVLIRKERILTLLLCLYIGFAIVSFVPEFENQIFNLKGENVFFIRLIVFFAFTIFLLFLLEPTSISSSLEEKDVSIFQYLGIVILGTGLLMSISLFFMPAVIQNEFSVPIKKLFLTWWAKAFWIGSPLIFLAFFNRKK